MNLAPPVGSVGLWLVTGGLASATGTGPIGPTPIPLGGTPARIRLFPRLATWRSADYFNVLAPPFFPPDFVTHRTLKQALISWLDSDPAIIAVTGGNLFGSASPDELGYPFARLADVGGTNELTFARNRREWHTFQLSLFDIDGDAADLAKAVIAARFLDRSRERLQWREGNVRGIEVGREATNGGEQVESGMGPGSNNIYHQMLTLRLLCEVRY